MDPQLAAAFALICERAGSSSRPLSAAEDQWLSSLEEKLGTARTNALVLRDSNKRQVPAVPGDGVSHTKKKAGRPFLQDRCNLAGFVFEQAYSIFVHIAGSSLQECARLSW